MVNIHVLGKSTQILLDATVTNVLSGVNGLVCSFMTHNTKNLDTSHTTSTAWTQGVIIRHFTYHPNQFGSEVKNWRLQAQPAMGPHTGSQGTRGEGNGVDVEVCRHATSSTSRCGKRQGLVDWSRAGRAT